MKTITFLSSVFILRLTQWLCYWRYLLFLPLMLAVVTLTSNIANAQGPPSIAGAAPMIVPTGGFGIDGDVHANFGQLLLGGDNEFGDWIYDPGLFPGPGRGVLHNTITALPINTATTFRTVDLTGNADLNGFYGGSKFNQSPADWTWKAGSSPQKDDMENVMIHFSYDLNGDLWFAMAGDRSFVSGTSYIDFELFQKPVTTSGNGFITGGLDGGRTVGDLAITIAYSSGGDNPEVVIYRWQALGDGFSYVVHIPEPNTVFAASNITAPITVPYDAFGSNTYPQYAFAEAAVNLFQVIEGIDQCIPIATVLIKTKASDALTAALKDMITPIQVNINQPPTVTVNDVAACSGDVPVQITATPLGGNPPYSYAWTVPGGVANPGNVASFMASVEGDYTVIVTDANFCVSEPDTGTLTINNVTPGVIAGSQTRCSPFDPDAFTSTTPGSGDGVITYQWQMSTTSAVAGFADIVGATSETYDAGVVAVQTWFRRVATSTVNGSICSDNSNALMVAPNAIDPGVIAGSQTLCSPFDPVAFTSTTPGTGDGVITYQWQMSTTSAVAGFSDIVGATSATYDAGVVAVQTWFRRVTTSTLNGMPCADNSNVLMVAPNAIVPGVIAGDQTLCSPFDPVAFTSTTPGSGDGVITYQWQMSTTSAVAGFSDIVGATSATYDAPAVAVVTWFRRVATSTLNGVPCADNSNVLMVAPNAIVPGVIAGSQTLCSPFDPVAFTSTTPGSGDGVITYQWQMSTTSAVAGFSDIVGATSETYDAPAVAVQTWFRRVATSTLNAVPCADNSNVLMVAPNAIDPGVIAGSQTLCSPFDPVAFTSTTPGSGDGTITYQWQMSTTSAVAGFSDIVGATSETYDAPAVAVVTWFRRVATSTLNAVPCADNSNVLTVSPNAIDPGVIAGSQTLCSPFDPVAFTSTTPGSGEGVITYQWQMSTTSAVAGFSDIVGATSETYDAPAVAVQTWFLRVATGTLNGAPCAANSNVLMVAPNAIDPGVIAGSQTLCSPFDPVAFTSTTPGTGDGTITYQWQLSTTSAVAGFSDIVGAISETYDAPAVAVQTWFRRVATSTLNAVPCADNSNVLMVAPNAIDPGVIAGSQTRCSPFDPDAFTSTTSGSGDGTITYQWQISTTSAVAGFSDIIGATSETYDAPAVAVQTWFRRVATSTLDAVPCADNSNVLMVAPNAIDPGSIAGDQTICEGEDPVAFTSVGDATGGGTIAYQWQSSTDGINFVDIVGATNAIYDEGILNASLWFKRLATSTLNGVVCDDESNIIKVTVEICVTGEGCTLGYWKNHTDRWCGTYTTCTLYKDVFTEASGRFTNVTLLEGLNLGGNSDGENLIRQSIAALLNACSNEVGFDLSVAQVIAQVNAAWDAGTLKTFATTLDGLNNQNCPLGGTTATTAPTPICVVAKVKTASTLTTTSTKESGIISLESSSIEEPVVIDSSVDFTVYPVPYEDVINVQYRFEYDTDVTIQVFNLQGALIYGAVDNAYNNGEIGARQISLARTFDQALIVRLTTNKENLNKTIVAKSSTQR